MAEVCSLQVQFDSLPSSIEHIGAGNFVLCSQEVSIMKIAQIAPLMESVPPRLYGGTERVVSFLTEELVALGHQVSLFATEDSVTSAELVPCGTRAIRLDGPGRDFVPYYMLMLDKVRRQAAEFDILHFHIDHFHFPLFRDTASRTLTTLHGRQDHRDRLPFFAGFHDMPLISISGAQRLPVPHANFVATVYHGLPVDLLRPNYHPRGGYLAFLGRISPEKGPVEAIRIAQKLSIPLKIAAKVDPVDETYFRDVVEPLLAPPAIEYVGEIGDKEKSAFLGDASAVLFPVCWPEPFGMVMIEAMACGTPVLAFRAGSVEEVIDKGVTGFVVDNIDQAVVALHQTISLDRRNVRRQFEERFSARRMANDYIRVYRNLLLTDAQVDRIASVASSTVVRAKRNGSDLADVEHLK
jgi:glycosyltransferase involved in cell wall biosynthesis